jgi:DNA topoisomerase I
MLNMKSVGLATDLDCPRCQRKLHVKWSRNGPFISCSGYPECNFTSDYERDEKGHVKLVTDQTTEETCEKCNRPMLLKRGRFGAFLACSGYPECKNTRSLTNDRTKDAPAGPVQVTDEKCEKCGGSLVIKNSRQGIAFLACGNYPKCKNTRPITTGIPCPRKGCAGELAERASKRGRRFFGCSKYPACKTAFWDQPVREECPECGTPVLLQKHSKRTGTKLVCANPDCKYARPVELDEQGPAV